MAKPSIFSKDYEKIMRKRRKRFTIITIIVVIVAGLVAVKAVNYDYSKLRDRLQRWVDGSNETVDNSSEANKPVEEPVKEEPETTKLPEEPKQEEKEEFLDVEINGVKLSFKLEENKEVNNSNNRSENGTTNNVPNSTPNNAVNTTSNPSTQVVNPTNGEATAQGNQEQVANNEKPKKFTQVKEIPEGYTVEISSTGQKAMVLDNNQNLYTVSINGEVKDVTLTKYIAPNGEVFEKEIVRSIYKNYLWHTSPKMINDNQIAYVSNIPYFGLDLNQYVSVVDTEKNTHIILWGTKAKNITFGSVTGKGLEVNLDGNIMYINNEGVLTS